MHLDFPGITFQVVKNHVQVHQEDEIPFESEVEPPASQVAETHMDAWYKWQWQQQWLIMEEKKMRTLSNSFANL